MFSNKRGNCNHVYRRVVSHTMSLGLTSIQLPSFPSSGSRELCGGLRPADNLLAECPKEVNSYK